MAFPRQKILHPQNSWRNFFLGLLKGRLIDGEKIGEFERAFAGFIGARDAIAIPSGRAGLKFILEGLRLDQDSEVIAPAYTYPIVPFIIKSMGIPMKFVDIEPVSLGLDPEKLKQAVSKKTKAVIATHLFGAPCDIRKILPIAKENNVDVIEDCAHSCGASAGETKTGAFGRAAYFSFETSKCINTLGGGMITTTDKELGQRIRSLRDQGHSPTAGKIFKRLLKSGFEASVTYPPFFSLFVYPLLRIASFMKGPKDVVGAGYVGSDITMRGRLEKYTNFQAGLGLEQLRSLTEINDKRIKNAAMLMNELEGAVSFQRPVSSEDRPNYLLFTILVPGMEDVALRLLKAGVDTKRYYMRDCSALYGTGEEFPNAARAEREALHIPSYPGLSRSDIEEIAARVKRAVHG
ncbi:MAG: aminotransferase class I/II-fold pyridoxal phosphate-dependent enzyme [Nitrospinae bacterium]|nr:aminotransferase class I/II-fold pyridoxal phosphate-dependent enzyme [Nitrospinota bacterium]